MTIRDLSSRIGVSHQAIRARIQRESGRSSGDYTDRNGDLTPDGLQLIADLYFAGNLSAIGADACLSVCDNLSDKQTNTNKQLTQADKENLSQETVRLSEMVASLSQEKESLSQQVERLSEMVASLSQEKDNLSQELASSRQAADNLSARNAQLETALLNEVNRVGELTRTIANQALSITRLADQAQQLQLASIAQQKKSIWLRLLGR
mgnify:CR=1 FL=1